MKNELVVVAAAAVAANKGEEEGEREGDEGESRLAAIGTHS